jgi:glycosyltransferase involved in cell wall biosynthesis
VEKTIKSGNWGLSGTSESRNYQLSLVIPALNEQETIGQALREAESALSGLVQRYEIIVVDDGSDDDTAAIVAKARRQNPHVRLVRHEGNLGYGAALRTGFQAAHYDLVGFTDADCQFDLGELRNMLPLTRQHDMICGFRIDRQDPLRRRFLSWGYNWLTRLLLGNPVRDIDCALKIFHRRHLPDLLPESNNFFVNTEMLSRACRAELSVAEVGVHHRPRSAGRSKVSLADIPRTLSALIPYWWSHHRTQEFEIRSTKFETNSKNEKENPKQFASIFE